MMKGRILLSRPRTAASLSQKSWEPRQARASTKLMFPQTAPPLRSFAAAGPTSDEEKRHTGIRMHPDSISKDILPGNMVLRKSRSGVEKKRYTELFYGYFWMIKDLKRSNEKPVLSNDKLIPASVAKPFPDLSGLKSLAGDEVDIPEYFLRKNRSRDAAAQCTLVAVSFRDFGYQVLDSWTEPFKATLSNNDRVEVYRMNLSEGWFNKWVLQPIIRGIMKRNTPEILHPNTLVSFGSDLEPFRDGLRMHNILTGYVFLLDGLGRVRFAGSGTAGEEEVEKLVALAQELTPLLKPAMNKNYPTKKGPKRRAGSPKR